MTRQQMTEKLRAISGAVIQSFKLVEGGTLILYLGHAFPLHTADQKATRLWIESAWRLCTDHKVIAGSLDRPDFLMPQLQKLTGMTVDSVRLDGIPGDITLLLESGIMIESFTRSVQDEQWQVRCGDGFRLGLRENLELYETMEESD
jgi:hypothetical protein